MAAKTPYTVVKGKRRRISSTSICGEEDEDSPPNHVRQLQPAARQAETVQGGPQYHSKDQPPPPPMKIRHPNQLYPSSQNSTRPRIKVRGSLFGESDLLLPPPPPSSYSYSRTTSIDLLASGTPRPSPPLQPCKKPAVVNTTFLPSTPSATSVGVKLYPSHKSHQLADQLVPNTFVSSLDSKSSIFQLWRVREDAVSLEAYYPYAKKSVVYDPSRETDREMQFVATGHYFGLSKSFRPHLPLVTPVTHLPPVRRSTHLQDAILIKLQNLIDNHTRARKMPSTPLLRPPQPTSISSPASHICDQLNSSKTMPDISKLQSGTEPLLKRGRELSDGATAPCPPLPLPNPPLQQLPVEGNIKLSLSLKKKEKMPTFIERSSLTPAPPVPLYPSFAKKAPFIEGPPHLFKKEPELKRKGRGEHLGEEAEGASEDAELQTIPIVTFQDKEIEKKFSVLIQYLASGLLDDSFFPSLQSSQDDYFCGIVDKVMSVIGRRQSSLSLLSQWPDPLQTAVEAFPHMEVSKDCTKSSIACGACRGSKQHTSFKLLVVKGPRYDKTTLLDLEEPEGDFEGEPEIPSAQFRIGRSCLRPIELYHRLYHYMKRAQQSCSKKLDFLATKLNLDMTSESDHPMLINSLLAQRKWLTMQHFQFNELVAETDQYFRTFSPTS